MYTVGLLVLPGTRTFDIAVPAEVWGVDRTDSAIGPFALRICTQGRKPLALHPVGDLRATHGFSGLLDCDLVIAPGRADPHAPVPAAAVRVLRQAHAAGITLASLCSGAFTLAAAGVLDGRPATTHWRLLAALAERAPLARLSPEVLFTDDGDVLTSAGVVGGVDLCLHLVRRDFGADLAARLAKRMVMPAARSGGQRQFVDTPLPGRPDGPDIGSTVDWARQRLAEPLGVPELAERSGMSERTFHRAFTAATGTTPGRWLQAERLRFARQLLETTALPVARVAQRSGLGTAANLRRRLHAELGVSPAAYRRTHQVC
ncbi:helix-turn-helix domain-containing protein [Crossiella sp. SN42]|uniref:GlxA family transcriptional regulator n=1 Tax=Crossiella sp. SN42 TaxID=2944808 RepID=UPI00207CF6E5|nr:helix-turn-helix domain-containing protein [Crossiella sp. SN42]MCO1579970.1 helix-turn-helix domain-containing protein [Crossiella sp. SN42]